MSQKEEIRDFIWSFINPNNEECGWIKFNEENTEKLQKYKNEGYIFNDDSFETKDKSIYECGLRAILHLAELEFNVQFEYDDVGGFDSPGYDIECYAWACITKDGELYFDSTIKECY